MTDLNVDAEVTPSPETAEDPAPPVATEHAIPRNGDDLDIPIPANTAEVVIRIKKPSTFNHIDAWFKPAGASEFYAQDFSRNASGTICNVWACKTVREGGILRLNVPKSKSVQSLIGADIDIAVTIIP